MKKKLASLALVIMVLIAASCHAASYTLPEKMYKQLAIGSGLKGTFTVTAEGEKFNTPFIQSIRDAEFDIRGIMSGEDLHYYVFQTDNTDQQSAFTELYRKDGIYYFRSDLVPGRILYFPTVSQYLESLFPVKGENVSPAAFIVNLISLPENDLKEEWDPVLTRYQNELEMWLAGFTVQAQTVKLDNGFSSLDFTYEIPMTEVNSQIVKLFGEFASDPDVLSLLDTVMTKEEKEIYVNSNLLYYYMDALNSFDLSRALRMNKRVSAMGEMLRFRLDLPLEEKVTGFQMLSIEMTDGLKVYTLKKDTQVIVLALPAQDESDLQSYEKSIWFARISSDTPVKDNIAARIDIKKTNETYKTGNEKNEEISHEINHYTLNIVQDPTYLPEDTERSLLPETETVNIDIELHYSSKYAQNSATTLNIQADVQQGDSKLLITAKVKTAAQWRFMPFEITDPVYTGTDFESILKPYLTDWISAAPSAIRYQKENTETATENIESSLPEVENQDRSADEDDKNAETAALEEPDQ